MNLLLLIYPFWAYFLLGPMQWAKGKSCSMVVEIRARAIQKNRFFFKREQMKILIDNVTYN